MTLDLLWHDIGGELFGLADNKSSAVRKPRDNGTGWIITGFLGEHFVKLVGKGYKDVYTKKCKEEENGEMQNKGEIV